MDLKTLSAKQKRFLQWSDFSSTPNIPTNLKGTLNSKLIEYKKLLTNAYNNPDLLKDTSMINQMKELEKQLEEINELIRLTVPTTLCRSYSK